MAAFPLNEKATQAKTLPHADCLAEDECQPSSSAPTASPRPPRHVECRTPNWYLIAFVFLPFAAGYYLSYLFRTINTLISGPLTSEFELGAGSLGLLTSIYFLTFAAAQVPVGILLDRYGPRKVQSAFLLIAAAGAVLFATSERFLPLVIARAMIGLGVAASLTAGLKAVVQWFPRERVALVNGFMIMCGALGAVTATAPAERLLAWIGWRALFEFLAATTALTAAILYIVVPEPLTSRARGLSPPQLSIVYTDLRFWKLMPLSATCVGSAWALQGLWAGPWLTDVDRLDRSGLMTNLFIMAVAVCLGGLLLGGIADRIRQRGIGTEGLLAVAAALSSVAQLALVLRLPLPAIVPWSVVAIAGAATMLSYASLAEYFPKEVAGRANGALNVFHLGWAFIVQYGIGLILAQWPRRSGHYPVIAYQVAFALNVVAQIAALLWFALPTAKTLRSTLRGGFQH
jgi:predicted MFS family arabinose efflux permease